MSEITIFDSRGEIRETTGDISHSKQDIERVRNYFLDFVYYRHEPEKNWFYIFCQMNTGSPEQFMVRYEYGNENELFAPALKNIHKYVNEDLGWSIIQREDKDWYQLLTSFSSTSVGTEKEATKLGDYQISVIQDVVKRDVFDLETPTPKDATDVVRTLHSACQNKTIVVAGNGRSRSINSDDIVITPSGSRDKIAAIDGSHEKYSNTFDSSIASNIITKFNHLINKRRQSGYSDSEQRLIYSLENEPHAIGRHGYVAKSKQTLKNIKKKDRLVTGILTGIISFVALFSYRVDSEGAVNSFTNEILDNNEAVPTQFYEFATPSTVLAAAGFIIIILMILLLISLATLVGGVQLFKSNSPSANTSYSIGQIDRTISDKLHKAKTEPSSNISSILRKISKRTTEINASVEIISESDYKKSRLFDALPAGLIAVSVFGLAGFFSARNIEHIIGALLTISVGIIDFTVGITLIALSFAVGYLLLTKLGKIPTLLILIVIALIILVYLFGIPDPLLELVNNPSQENGNTTDDGLSEQSFFKFDHLLIIALSN